MIKMLFDRLTAAVKSGHGFKLHLTPEETVKLHKIITVYLRKRRGI
jgi:hypothetical protein